MAEASGNQRGHAQYAPSSAHRWMRCAASVKATANIPSLSSAYAAEGTVAHDVLERALNAGNDAHKYIGEIIDVEIEGKPSSLIVTKEMAEAVQVCLDYIKTIVPLADFWAAEQQVTLALFGAASCYGTSDFTATVYVASRIIVIDYKHGAGIAVEVKDNEQLKIYGLGALLKLKTTAGVSHVQTTIVQPRIPHPRGAVRSHTYSIAELMEFGTDVLAAIERCESDRPEYVPGEWCKWCGIENTCGARIRAVGDIVAVINEIEDGHVLVAPDQERLLAMLEGMDIEGFVTSLRASLHKYAEEGGVLTKYKLVPKRGTRVWLKDESETIKALTPLLAKKKASRVDLYNATFKSPAEVEKVVGKGADARAVLAGLAVSVSSGTNLVPVDDVRQPALITAEDEFDSLTD